MKKITLLLKSAVCLLISTHTFSQQIYSNGNLSTGAISASGVAAPSGYTWSEVQSETGNTTESNTNYGFGAIFNTANTANLQLADDFIVPTGSIYNATSFDFFCYQTGYVGTLIPIDQLRIQVFSGDPSAGGTLVAGNMTTNVLDVANSADALIYRTGNSVTPSPGATTGTTRKIWRVRGNLTVSLPAGTYWIVYQVHATDDLNIFFPPVTILGTRGLVGWNAKQNTVVGTTLGWGNVKDLGNPATAPDFSQDMPFYINGTVLLSVKQNSLDSLITFFPNPTKNFITITNSINAVINTVEIADINGRIVKRNVFNATQGQMAIGDLSTGVYMMKITSDQGTVTKKIVKE